MKYLLCIEAAVGQLKTYNMNLFFLEESLQSERWKVVGGWSWSSQVSDFIVQVVLGLASFNGR